MPYSVERISPTVLRFHVTVDKAAPEADMGASEHDLLDLSIQETLRQEGILPLSPVRLLPAEERKTPEESFCFEAETLPDVAIPEDLSTIKVAVEEPLPDPREFQHAVMELRRSRASLHAVEERRQPRDGDVLRLNISAFSDGRKVPGMGREGFTMLLRPMSEMSEVESAARSLFAGESRTVTTLCPEDHPDPDLRGKPVEIRVELVSINREELPDFDEALAKDMGFSSLDKLKHAVFERIMGEKIRNIQSRAQKRLLDTLLEGQHFLLPDTLMAMNREDCLQEARSGLRRQGKNDKEIAALLEEMRDDITEQATYRARVQALLLSLASREHMEISQEEADRQILKIAELSHQEYEKLHDTVWKSRLIHDLQLRLLSAKALQFLYKHVEKVVVDSEGKPVPAPQATGKVSVPEQ